MAMYAVEYINQHLMEREHISNVDKSEHEIVRVKAIEQTYAYTSYGCDEITQTENTNKSLEIDVIHVLSFYTDQPSSLNHADVVFSCLQSMCFGAVCTFFLW